MRIGPPDDLLDVVLDWPMVIILVFGGVLMLALVIATVAAIINRIGAFGCQ